MVNSLAGRTTHPAFRIYHTAWQAADWLFPPSCAGCGKFGFRWCPNCEKEIQAIPQPICPVCNQSVSRPGKCNNCKAENPAFSTLKSLGSYTGPLRKVVLQIKYRHDIGVCEIFAFKLLNLVESNQWSVDQVIAVPLAPQHKKNRGYNQAELLAKPLAWLLNIPFASDAVKRIKQTGSQVGKNAVQRKANVENAFVANPEQVSGKCVLLVDDIATTCATLNECSKALINAGASQVFAVTLARAILSQDSLDQLKILGFQPNTQPTLSGG